MATCYQKHPFEIESDDHLTTINTKIYEIKKKIQLSEGQRKSHYEENEAEKQLNSNLIDTLKKEIKERFKELAQARAVIGEDEVRIKKYLNNVCPIKNKGADQIIYNLDLKVIELHKMLDLLRYERKKKKTKLRTMEKEYEELLIENSKSANEKIKIINPARKQASHIENEIHRVSVQWNEAELVKKKYTQIRQALVVDAVKFDRSLNQIQELLMKQKEEIRKLESIREEAAEMRARATAALASESSRTSDAEHARTQERAYFSHRFDERKRELEKIEKRIFPPAVRAVVRQDSENMDLPPVPEEDQSSTSAGYMEEVFQKLMKVTGVTEAELVFERFRSQRETSSRLNYLQRSTEEEKLALEGTQTSLLAQLEAFKFAQVKDKDETQDQINELKSSIELESEQLLVLTAQLSETNALLGEMKRSLYDLCKLLESVSSTPAMPEWTQEVRDVQGLVDVLGERFASALARSDDVLLRSQDTGMVVVQGSTSAGASLGAGPSVHSTPREPDAAPPLTYKELLQREVPKPPPSDEEEDIPSRSYLKRQAQLIIDTKSRRKGFRMQYPRK